jgi:simple sugar transport system permease protein
LGGTLKEATPLLIAGIAVFIALRAGLFNIGVEGQLLMGAMAAAEVVLRVPGSAGICLGILAAALAGALWAWPAGLIRAYRNGHEVITTIMLNSCAANLTSYLVAGPLKASGQGEPTTPSIAVTSYLPSYNGPQGLQISFGLAAGVLIAGLVWVWLRRSVSGYELQAVGANPTAAAFAGLDPKRVVVRSMLTSGAVAGIAGAVQVLAYEGRFYSDFSPGYGFNALGVALLAGSNPFALIPAGLLFGILAKGGTALQIDGVPKGITTVILGLLIVVAAAIRYRRFATIAR